MTGTAETEETEFFEIYKLEVSVIPTNRPMIRDDRHDLVYKTRREKYNAIVDETKRLHGLGFPVLVGTTSVDASETLARLFQRAGLVHNVLNAKYHQREAEIVALAPASRARSRSRRTWPAAAPTSSSGRASPWRSRRRSRTSTARTSTSRSAAGCTSSDRSGTSRAASTGSCAAASGRQGDPGASQFFLSLEDDLMRLFGSDRIARLMDRMGAEEGEMLTHPLITRSIEQAQKRVELQNFQSRKRLLEYDDVMNQQREVIYSLRVVRARGRRGAEGRGVGMIEKTLDRLADEHAPAGEHPGEWALAELRQRLMLDFFLDAPRLRGGGCGGRRSATARSLEYLPGWRAIVPREVGALRPDMRMSCCASSCSPRSTRSGRITSTIWTT